MTSDAPLINSVSQAFKILEFIILEGREVTLSYLCQKMNLPPSTGYRYLSTLLENGYLRKTPSGAYKAGFKIVELSSCILKTLDLREIAHPYLVELMVEINQTAHLAIKEGYEGVYLDKVEGPGTLPMISRVGMRMSLYSTGFGKAILAYLSSQEIEDYLAKVPLLSKTPNTITDLTIFREELRETRERGYAFDDQENEEGIRCLGVPLFDFSGKVIGAISVAGHYPQFEGQKKIEMAKVVMETANKINAILQGRQKDLLVEKGGDKVDINPAL